MEIKMRYREKRSINTPFYSYTKYARGIQIQNTANSQ